MVEPGEKIKRIIKEELHQQYNLEPKMSFDEWRKYKREEVNAYIEKRWLELEEQNNEVY